MSNKIGKVRQIKERPTPHDKVYTPLEVARMLIEMTDIKETDTVLDPSKGGGVFFDNLPPCREKYFCEIDEGIDFFEFHNEVTTIIGNPPYSLWNRWLEHSVSLKPRKIAYVFGMLNVTPLRLKLLKDNGYVLSKLHITTVAGWFANCVLAVFERDGNPVLTFDTKRHKIDT
jgi:hypothetical protein